jgi:FtsP/CotA-like multicopper oxidase with cupredoxin domain
MRTKEVFVFGGIAGDGESMKKKYALMVLIITALAFFSCEETAAGKRNEPQKPEARNPYNILQYQPQTEYEINIIDGEAELKRGAATAIYQYETGLPGGMIIVSSGKLLRFHVKNSIEKSTSLHWHGLRVPIEQDGPMKELKAGESTDFEFTLNMTGTHWYHPHMRPILPQLNAGLYAPFIVKEDYDSKYAGDYVLTLDDWTINPLNNSIDDTYGGSHGYMEVIGNVETVNRRYGNNIYPVTLKKGEIVKLRFINASTAQSHTLSMDEHEFRVTHLDGHKLVEPYTEKRIRIAPGERVDAELKGIKSDGTYYIRNERGYGMRIPVIYEGAGEEMESPFVPGESEAFPGIAGRSPDKVFELNSNMDHEAGDGSHGSGSMATAWTINGKAYGIDDDIDIFSCAVGQVYILRFDNMDIGGIMHHINQHPIHLHGGHFQVVSIDGQPPEREMWKDTMEIPRGKYIDVAVKFHYPGHWMLHCHIIDHEDNGMLTMIHAE